MENVGLEIRIGSRCREEEEEMAASVVIIFVSKDNDFQTSRAFYQYGQKLQIVP